MVANISPYRQDIILTRGRPMVRGGPRTEAWEVPVPSNRLRKFPMVSKWTHKKFKLKIFTGVGTSEV